MTSPRAPGKISQGITIGPVRPSPLLRQRNSHGSSRFQTNDTFNHSTRDYGDYTTEAQEYVSGKDSGVVDLADEYSEQIEYNNQLLQQLQQAELKSQEKTRQLAERDQEFRNMRLEMQYLKQESEQLKEENYRMKLAGQQMEGELEHCQHQMEGIQMAKKHLQQEREQIQEKFETSRKTVRRYICLLFSPFEEMTPIMTLRLGCRKRKADGFHGPRTQFHEIRVC